MRRTLGRRVNMTPSARRTPTTRPDRT